MTFKRYLDRYVEARGLVFRLGVPSGRKVCEEATEFAIAVASGDHLSAKLELADVVIAATRQAELLETTVEECLELKIAFDTGRDVL